MAQYFEAIPLFNEYLYSMNIALNKSSYTLTFRFSQREYCWYLDVYTRDKVPLVLSTKLVPYFPLVKDFDIPELGGYFMLFPIVESNVDKLTSDPQHIADYFQLFFTYEK